mmetsp:Transcript_9585/g.15932  ORF Transcript_9585/g.15932 Transcript_9585/m.15932 type:complete len:507 (-) Transcript_9585:31-1551(-)
MLHHQRIASLFSVILTLLLSGTSTFAFVVPSKCSSRLASTTKGSSKPNANQNEKRSSHQDPLNLDIDVFEASLEQFEAEVVGHDWKDEHDFLDDGELIETLHSFTPTNLHVDENWITPRYEQEHEIEGGEGHLSIWAARALLLMVAILWGTNFASVKYLESLCFHPPCHHLPSEAALARFGVAALASLPLLIGQRKDVIFAGFECGIWITLGYITQAMALSTIPSGKCAFICSLTVVVVPLINAFFGKEIKPVHIASAALAILGVGVLEGMLDIPALLGTQPAIANVLPTLDASSTLTTASVASAAAAAESTDWLASAAAVIGVTKGDILALGQPFGFGISFMRIEHYVEKFKDVENRVLTISAAECVAVGMMALLWVLFDFSGHIPDMTYMVEPHRIGAILWTGIMTTVVAIYCEGLALETASATEAALTFSSEPVWASLFGAWLLREQLNLESYVGGAIILSACLLSAVSDLPGAAEGVEHEKVDETKTSPTDLGAESNGGLAP